MLRRHPDDQDGVPDVLGAETAGRVTRNVHPELRGRLHRLWHRGGAVAGDRARGDDRRRAVPEAAFEGRTQQGLRHRRAADVAGAYEEDLSHGVEPGV